ncbi:hypothetical protein JYT48_03230, partial [Mariprofundus ferrooxydans]|nr:hypothetical protein [Mariprofundus ferrooxydans]
MPIAKGYLSRVVADAHRPTHSSSMPHAMNSCGGFDLALSPVADKPGQLSADQVAITKQETEPKKKHQNQVSEASQDTRHSKVADVRQSKLLPNSSSDRGEQHPSEKNSVDVFVPGTSRNFGGLTGAIVGQENDRSA